MPWRGLWCTWHAGRGTALAIFRPRTSTCSPDGCSRQPKPRDTWSFSLIRKLPCSLRRKHGFSVKVYPQGSLWQLLGHDKMPPASRSSGGLSLTLIYRIYRNSLLNPLILLIVSINVKFLCPQIPLSQQVFQLRHGHRSAEQVSLRLITTLAAQECQLFLSFYTFRHNLEPQIVGK
jgi:hypothetical protein